MQVKPLNFEDATDEIKEIYQKLIKILEVNHLPIFFQYFGSFPEYLKFISPQIINLLSNEKFKIIIDENEKNILQLFKNQFFIPEEIFFWRQKYQHTPFYYHFESDLKKISLTNLKIAFLFISLREAVKGWAIASKKLTSKNKFYKDTGNDYIDKKNIIIFEDLEIIKNEIIKNSKTLLKNTDNKLEINLLYDYLNLCKKNFYIYYN